jgi:hypothetical protein
MTEPSTAVPTDFAQVLLTVLRQTEIFRAEGHSEEAAEVLQAVFEMLPNEPRILLDAANSLWECGDRDKARRLWKTCREIAPNWSEAAFYHPSAASQAQNSKQIAFEIEKDDTAAIIDSIRQNGFAHVRNLFDPRKIGHIGEQVKNNIAFIQNYISETASNNISVLPLAENTAQIQEFLRRRPNALNDRTYMEELDLSNVEEMFQHSGLSELIDAYFGFPVPPNWRSGTVRNFDAHPAYRTPPPKPLHSGTFHQDSRIGKLFGTALVLWIPFQDISKKDTRVSIVRQRFEQFFPTISKREDPEHAYKCDGDLIPTAKVCAPELSMGDALLFTTYTVHGSHYPPKGSGPRLSFDVRFVDTRNDPIVGAAAVPG